MSSTRASCGLARALGHVFVLGLGTWGVLVVTIALASGIARGAGLLLGSAALCFAVAVGLRLRRAGGHHPAR